MAEKVVRIAMNGVTGRMGYRQHLLRSVLAIRDGGGLSLDDGTLVHPQPVLVGRDEGRLARLAHRHGVDEWSTSLDDVLGDESIEIYFDSQVTSARAAALTKAMHAGKHVYTEKPTAQSMDEALELARVAARTGVCNGVVQDKLFLPGLLTLRRLVASGFFGRILSVRGEFGYWVFDGQLTQAQRPSWNYRLEDGGGIVSDMFCHWRYVLDEIIAPVRAVTSLTATHVPRRWDEDGKPYDATADDAAYAIFELEGGVIAQVNSSWATRVHRDELVIFQVDGTNGSAVAGLQGCRVQPAAATPVARWDPDVPQQEDFRAQWLDVPTSSEVTNGFRKQWEMFLAHVVSGAPFEWDLLRGAKGVQLAELGLRSAREGLRIEVPELAL